MAKSCFCLFMLFGLIHSAAILIAISLFTFSLVLGILIDNGCDWC